MRKALTILLVFVIMLSGCINTNKTKNTQQNGNVFEKTMQSDKKNESQPITDSEDVAVSDSQTIPKQEPSANKTQADQNKIIVIDPGHGKSSSLMTDEEKIASGFVYNNEKGWGEWRHFKSGTMWHDCQGSGCSGRAPEGGSCWYPIGYGDRDIEPEINYNNALSAKMHLEKQGYTVRLARSQNDNPSLSQRLKSCYPNGDITKEPDASAYICLHSNAGGGSGSCYISLWGLYDQAGIQNDYVEAGNKLGEYINNSIVQNTPLTASGNGRYDGYPELVIFCKSPVPVAYMEIGFYDNPGDLNIIQNNHDEIGKAIADGIHRYFTTQK